MKKYILLGTVAALGLSMASCDDFLNDNRYPLSEQTVAPEFWDNPTNVENQINYFYESFAGYGNTSGTNGTFYYTTLSDDQGSAIGGDFRNWTYTNVPSSSSNWNAPYTEIRRCNLVIEGVTGSTLGDTQKANYLAIARLMRAYQYYQLVRAYGDVPLVEKALDPADEAELFGPRTARNTVMDFVLEDLNYAVANITAQDGKTVFSKDMANAMKAEICLFEGAYAKYHADDKARSDKFFTEVVNATTPFLSGSYELCDDYQSLYNSARSKMPNGMPGLDTNKEIIFFKPYEQGVFMHSLCDWTGSSTPIAGITRDAFESFLFLDGKPMSAQADKVEIGTVVDLGEKKDADGKPVLDSDGKPVHKYLFDISNVLAARDKRLSAIIDPAVYFTGQVYKRPNTMEMTSSTGYGVTKFDNLAMSYEDVTTANRNYTSAPLFWLARIYMAYAEAKAELGTLTDGDLNATVNKLYARAGLPAQTVAGLQAMNAADNNMGVSSLLFEIRRCRRCEFMLDDGIRYWDLIRWKQLELLDNTQHPNVFLGANVSTYPNTSGITVKNGYVDSSMGMDRKFDAKHYFYPVPSGQIGLNKQLTQNPGWK